MSDRFSTISTNQLAAWIFGELERESSIFGIPKELFFRPDPGHPFRRMEYGQPLDTPFGVAAGPHSQLAQNIVVAWLCGARFMELKTVQTLDELEISKPCIDMEDEGYNVEWSQELKVHESFDEYLRAWVLLHVLQRELGLHGEGPGTIFNLSVGYNLDGIRQPNVQWFLDQARDCSALKAAVVEELAAFRPWVRDLDIPDCLSDNVTLSTMHGCPPDEIEDISRYLIAERRLHTSVKLNPTLLGPEVLRGILNDQLGYEDVVVPDEAFGHDLKWDDAVPMLRRLQALADDVGVQFGVKLSNTLEVQNHRSVFGESEGMMYLSGRPLQALTSNLATRLSSVFDGRLKMSYAGGADAFSVADLLGAGMRTITVCSDLLKSGGYLRLLQYMEQTSAAMDASGVADLDAFILAVGDGEHDEVADAARANLEAFAARAATSPELGKQRFFTSSSKTDRTLGTFDCIAAPCTDECPVDQFVPGYMRAVREGRFDDAVALARRDNVIPSVLGRICDRKCQNTCIRTHLDEPLAIREMKRFVMSRESAVPAADRAPSRDVSVAIVGAGPCGLAVARDLAQAGYRCVIFEQEELPGGMLSATIPSYRLPMADIQADVDAVVALGVEIRYGRKAGRDFSLADLKEQGFAHVVLAVGAQIGKRLGLPGDDAPGVVDAIHFLREIRAGRGFDLGARVAVIGAGDVAMDAARTAWRLGEAETILVYRRTIGQMPADPEEIEGLLEEGIPVHELCSPKELILEDGRLKALLCQRMELGPKGADGRRRPVPIEGEELTFELDTVLMAVSQATVLDFFGDEAPDISRWGHIQADPETLETSLPGVFVGGDVALEGPSSAVKACGDGRRIASVIRAREEGWHAEPDPMEPAEIRALIGKRAHRGWQAPLPHRSADDRRHFEEVLFAFDEQTARQEAERCLDCDRFCSLCVGVCPNLAFQTWLCPPMLLDLPIFTLSGDAAELTDTVRFGVRQQPQVLVLADFCNECGNCATFCPTAGEPYRDKARLYLDAAEFEGEADNAFRLVSGRVIEGRFGGATHRLEIGPVVTWTGDRVEATFDRATLELKDARPIGPVEEGAVVSGEPAATMLALLLGLGETRPWLIAPGL
jgi:putative selenate reductase